MKIQISLLMIILVVFGCSSNPVPTAISAPSQVTAKPSTNSAGMTTYVDKRSGIAFDYPSSWTMIEPSDDNAVLYSYSIASFDMNNKAGIGKESASGVPPGETKIDVTFYGADETPDSARRTVQSDVDSGFAIVTKEETRTAPDGSPAYYYEIQGRIGGAARVIYTRIDGHTVGVVAYGSGEDFEAIVKSLRQG